MCFILGNHIQFNLNGYGMAGIIQHTNVKFDQKELTITEVLQTRSVPIIVKTRTHRTRSRILNQYGMPENREMLLQRIICVKYARVEVLTSLNGEDTQGKREDDDISDNHYLIPVQYHGKIKFVHRPGSRRRYASVSQVLNDLPRYITVWEDTPAQTCSGAGAYIIVEANTTLEIVRKTIRPENKATFLECSNGETFVAFSEEDRLNCTAIDDTKLYNLFELVRSKLLPRVFRFEAIDQNDISHVDDKLYSKTLSVVGRHIELQGFTDVELLVGCVRNEIQEMYEIVLIPRNIWSSLLVHTECPESKANTTPYVASSYGPCEEVDSIEKSLYLLPLHQSEAIWLIGPAFINKGNLCCSNKTTIQNVYTDLDDIMPQMPVVLLPQVKKKQTIFMKVHAELLRMFKSNDDGKPSQPELKKLPISQETTTPKKLQKRFTKSKQNRISRSASLREMRSEPINLKCTRRKYGDTASYLEFYVEDPSSPSLTVKQEHSRLSVSLGDIPGATFPPTNSFANSALHFSSFSSNLENQREDYSEIVDIQTADEKVGTDTTWLGTGPIEQSYETRYAQESSVAMHNVPSITSKHNVWIGSIPGRHVKNEIPTNDRAKEVFYQYTVIETYECFKQCGLGQFAMKCKKHKLDGSFFRNFDYEDLKDDPFYLSKFSILKLTKIIHEGWRPT